AALAVEAARIDLALGLAVGRAASGALDAGLGSALAGAADLQLRSASGLHGDGRALGLALGARRDELTLGAGLDIDVAALLDAGLGPGRPQKKSERRDRARTKQFHSKSPHVD